MQLSVICLKQKFGLLIIQELKVEVYRKKRARESDDNLTKIVEKSYTSRYDSLAVQIQERIFDSA